MRPDPRVSESTAPQPFQRAGGALLLAVVTLLLWSVPALAEYTMEGLGTLDSLYSEPAAINDLGQVAMSLTGH